MDEEIKKDVFSFLTAGINFCQRLITYYKLDQETKTTVKTPESNMDKPPTVAVLGYETMVSSHFKLGEFLRVNHDTWVRSFPKTEATKVFFNGQWEYMFPIAMLNDTIIANIKKTAAKLEIVRTKYGKPIEISRGGGLRMGAYNYNAGGVDHSLHMLGLAADITIKGVEPKKIYGELIALKKTGEWVLEPSWMHVGAVL